MRKTLIILMILLLGLSFTACGSGKNSGKGTEGTAQTAEVSSSVTNPENAAAEGVPEGEVVSDGMIGNKALGYLAYGSYADAAQLQLFVSSHDEEGILLQSAAGTEAILIQSITVDESGDHLEEVAASMMDLIETDQGYADVQVADGTIDGRRALEIYGHKTEEGNSEGTRFISCFVAAGNEDGVYIQLLAMSTSQIQVYRIGDMLTSCYSFEWKR